MKTCHVCALAIVCFTASTAIVRADDQTEIQKLSSVASGAGDEFGAAVAVDGDRILIGARLDPALGVDAGRVFPFSESGGVWSLEPAFTASDTTAGDRFGNAVDISSIYAIVGTPRNSDDGTFSGSAYIYTLQGSAWGLEVSVTASDASPFDVFGIATAIDSDHAVVGALGNDDGGNLTGSAYVFVRSGSLWSEQAKLLASDRAVRDVFGTSVAISGNLIVVGAPGDQTSTSPGSAYVFRRSGSNWNQEKILVANDAANDDELGTSVAVDGVTVATGAPKHNGTGAVYVFVDNAGSWPQTFKVTASDGMAGDQFGATVALEGDLLVVGAPGADSGAGALYAFKRSGQSWVEVSRFVASDAEAGDALGAGLSVSGDTILGGAPMGNAGYVFSVGDLDCNANGIPDACDIDCGATNAVSGNLCSLDYPVPNCGTQSDCNTNGIPDGCEPDCDSNGIPDTCDIENGVLDCNGNAVPDVCEYFDQSVFLDASFDAGLPTGWGVSGLWHATSNCDQGGGCDALGWAYFGEDLGCDFDTGLIESGVLSVEVGSIPATINAAYLEYCSFYDGDRGAAPGGFDAAWVSVNGAIVDDVGPNATVGVWETRVVDLSTFAGQSVSLAWNFDSIDEISNDGVGWQVDQVELVIDSDCNGNGVIDECDIASGFSPDCDTNGLPDECDLDRGVDDCNSNGVPDVCESAEDCNLNEVFDICEQRLIFVDRTATTGGNDGSDWSNAYTELQTALIDVNTNCLPAEVWVAQGVYRPDGPGGSREATFALPDGVQVYGGFTGVETERNQRNADAVTNATVLSGDLDSNDIAAMLTDNAHHVVTIDAVTEAPTLDGFTIEGGVANEAPPNDTAGGLRVLDSTATVRNCLVKGNTAISGGAMRCSNSTVTFESTDFVDNTSAYGGAVYMVTDSTGVFDGCRFLSNIAEYSVSDAGGIGGAMFISSGSTPTIQNCVFTGNLALNMNNGSVEANGGALYLTSTADANILNSTFVGNEADDFGGAIALTGASNAVIQNSILWNNADTVGMNEASQVYRAGGTVALDTSCVMGLSGSLGGVGNIGVDPLLADSDGADNLIGTLDDDLALSPVSPCIDAGDNTAALLGSVPLVDIEGLPRFADDPFTPDTGIGSGPIIDMGAYEQQPDCNNNAIPDAEDIASGTSEDCTFNGIPDECEPDCNLNAVADSCDIAGEDSDDCNADGIPDECNIDMGSAAPGGPFFCTSQCSPDLNNNGIPDSCDISGGTSSDCNGSGVPDENKIDCNANAIPDECEDFSDVLESSFLLGPLFGGAGPVEYIVNDTRPAVGDVTITFSAIADLASPVETILVELNGTSLSEIFTGTANDCSPTPDVDAITLSANLYNQLVGVGPPTIVMTASAFVDECPQGSSISVSVQYRPIGDCNANGVPDDCDISGATSVDVDANDVPDECEDCNGNTIPDVIDIGNQTSGDANSNGIPDECEDCNTNGIPDDLDISGGGSLDENANEIPDECEDCNDNGTLDDFDIINMTSDDCNQNGTPDECEIDAMTPGGTYFCLANCAVDCNADGTPDVCEIDSDSDAPGGLFFCDVGCDADCNTNGVPDDCDAMVGADCDSNGVPDECQADTDSDGAIDECEACPLDGTKLEPGICGCGQSDTLDSDDDGVIDCLDFCSETGAGKPVDADGCPFEGACCFEGSICFDGIDPAECGGTYQGNGTTCTTDSDADGFTNCSEECPQDPNKTLAGACGCGVLETDTDEDGVPDCLDLCLQTPAAAMVDSNGCRLVGACCTPGGACNDNITEAFCDSQSWFYQGNGSSCAANCTDPPPGDYDMDGDVDLTDYAEFEICLSGPSGGPGFATPSALCRLAFDSDGDADVDVIDFGAFQEQSASSP